MNTGPSAPLTPGPAVRLARLALACYPPAWRARYRDEVLTLVDDTGADSRTVASLARSAVAAWVLPPRHLHDPPARVRASVAAVLAAWTVLAGLGLVFGQLTEDQGSRTLTPGHPLVQWLYSAYAVAAHISVAVVLVGGLPLWWSLLRLARRRGRRRDIVLLTAPAVVPVGFLAALILTARLVRQSGGAGIGQDWFVAFVILGFAAGGVAATGPMIELRRLQPSGRSLRVAVMAAGAAALTMVFAGLTSITDAIGLYLWSGPGYAELHNPWSLGGYLCLVLLAGAIACVSAARGIRAAVRPGWRRAMSPTWRTPDRPDRASGGLGQAARSPR